jgi:hypothetical protein
MAPTSRPDEPILRVGMGEEDMVLVYEGKVRMEMSEGGMRAEMVGGAAFGRSEGAFPPAIIQPLGGGGGASTSVTRRRKPSTAARSLTHARTPLADTPSARPSCCFSSGLDHRLPPQSVSVANSPTRLDQ